LVLCWASQASASVFGDIRGIVFDPQHRAIAGANIRVRSKSSDFVKNIQSDAAGQFLFRAIPIGEYTITIEAAVYKSIEHLITLVSGSVSVLSFRMTIATFF